jgi:hypothetical protein
MVPGIASVEKLNIPVGASGTNNYMPQYKNEEGRSETVRQTKYTAVMKTCDSNFCGVCGDVLYCWGTGVRRTLIT